MIDWLEMVGVKKGLEYSTLEIAITILDQYLLESVRKSNRPNMKSNIYLLGITCIWIATKYFEIVPLRLAQIEDDLGHFKFS